MNRKLSGDTLIEVMFAFAVLATIAGVTFAGALSSYKTSISAQWRTESTFVAQYQAEALLAYRKSLSWDVFLNGSNLSNQVAAIPNGAFCMKNIPAGANTPSAWAIETATCNNIAKSLMSNVPDAKMSVLISKPDPNDDTKRIANIEVSWLNKSNQTESVKNVLLLTKEQ